MRPDLPSPSVRCLSWCFAVNPIAVPHESPPLDAALSLLAADRPLGHAAVRHQAPVPGLRPPGRWPMDAAAIRRCALDGSLEVEHLLHAARGGMPGLADELTRLCAELSWPLDAPQADGRHGVPMARWAQVASAYSRGGLAALAPLAMDPAHCGFVLAMLEVVGTPEALEALCLFYQPVLVRPESAPEAITPLCRTIHRMLCGRHGLEPSPSLASRLRSFLHRVLRLATCPAQSALVVFALRGVGNEETLELLATLPRLESPFQGARGTALRAIRRRLRVQHASHNRSPCTPPVLPP